MTEPAVATEPAAPAAPAPQQGATAATPSVAGGAELGAEVPGRAKAIAKAREAMEARDKASRDQAVKQAEEHATKTRAKSEREKAPSPERGDDGKFRSALSPGDAEKQAKEESQAKPTSPTNAKPADPDKVAQPGDDATELERLEEQWRKARGAKKAAKAEKKAAAAWRDEQARTSAEKAADEKLRTQNPAAWLEKHGFDFREVAKSAVAKVDPSPAEKAAREALEKAERLERELKERDEREAQRTSEERRQAALSTLNREHAEAWTGSAKDYPTLAEHYTPEDVVDTLTQLRIDYYREHQREVPVATALAHMEKLAQREKARFTKAAKASERTERATVAAKAEKTRAVVGPVTNKDAAVSATPPKGLTPDERRARSTQLAAQGWRR